MSDVKKNILLICEGNTEERLFKKLISLFPIGSHYEVYQYKTNIYALVNFIKNNYDSIKELEAISITQILRELSRNSVEEVEILSKKFTDIILLFDFEPHDANFSKEDIVYLQEIYSESTDRGQLYINYPMIESAFHFSSLPDDSYLHKTVHVDVLKNGNYKRQVGDEGKITIQRLDNSKLPFILNHTYEKIETLVGISINSYNKLLDYQIIQVEDKGIISVLSTVYMFLHDYNRTEFLVLIDSTSSTISD